jgi:hypothetical protein
MRPKPSAAPNPDSVDTWRDVVLLPVHRKANPLHSVQAHSFSNALSNTGNYGRSRPNASELKAR